MSFSRLYQFDPAARPVESCKDINRDDDSKALSIVQEMIAADIGAIEVWQGTRLVRSVTANHPPAS
jgi:hypothetical protein